ncbi:hypothetical protein GCL60_16785 [Silvanigrella paludirubra]|uniref:Uncharacterized protein n=1 Tax=Silvanigrella paludirubra TaxID=2499159 RepID=A0A6N6VNE3_9BACT|nr:hypothetical protein [Silvanigrella paludirubra]KAB8035886.1 hypothetical protein GCL60_16785 [Silvanigrella paludirubra]
MSSGSFIRLSYPLSAKLGISKSLVLQKIIDWVSMNKSNPNMKKGNAIWVKRSAQELSQDLDGNLSARSIERHLSELVNDGWVIKENFNINNFDRTCWYTPNGRMINQATKEWNSEQTDIRSESETDNLSKSCTQNEYSDIRNDINSPNTIITDKEYKKIIEEEQINIEKNISDLKKTKIRVVKTNEKKLDDRTSQMLKSGIDAFVKSYEHRYKAKFLDFATLSRSIQSIIKKMGATFSEQNLIDCVNCYLRSQNSWHVTKGHSPIYLAGDIQNIFAAAQNNRNVATSLQAKKGDVSQTIDSNIMNALNSLKKEMNSEILDI